MRVAPLLVGELQLFNYILIYIIYCSDNEEWLKQRVPISKYIMMPRKMADYWRPFNDVTVDLVKHIRHFRGKDDVMADTVAIMSKWSLECKARHSS